MKYRLCFLGAVLGVQLVAHAFAQETHVDPNRVFTTDLRWEKAGTPHGDGLRSAHGTLVILYLNGVYAEVAASFNKTNGKAPVGLNLKNGYVIRLGTWSRTEDDILIRTQSREVDRDKSPGPLTTNTCRLEHPSSTHIADAIVCTGLTVFHSQHAIDLNDFPSMVHYLVKAQESEIKSVEPVANVHL